MLLSFFCFGLKAQTSSLIDDVEMQGSNTEGKIRIIQEEPIRTMVEKHQWAKSKQTGIMGYRIRIFSNSGPKAKAEYDKTMAQFAYAYDTIPLYPKFVYPNYKIYVGDFRTESEALKFRKTLDNDYRFKSAFMVYTQINYPKIQVNE